MVAEDDQKALTSLCIYSVKYSVKEADTIHLLCTIFEALFRCSMGVVAIRC